MTNGFERYIFKLSTEVTDDIVAINLAVSLGNTKACCQVCRTIRNLNLTMNKISIQTTQEILRLRNILQNISNISYSFSKINQKYPLDTLSEEDGNEITEVYLNLIRDTKRTVDKIFTKTVPI